MFKQWFGRILVGLALTLALAGGGVVADALGFDAIQHAHACDTTGGTGGGC